MKARFCHACGFELVKDSRFCSNCGTALGAPPSSVRSRRRASPPPGPTEGEAPSPQRPSGQVELPLAPTPGPLQPVEPLVSAGPWRRLGASLVNGFITLLLYGVFRFFVPVALVYVGGPPSYKFLFLIVVLDIVATSLLGGTLGQLALGLRVVGRDGQRLSLGRSAVRYAVFMAGAWALLLGVLSILWDSQRRGWHDKASQSFVVHRAAVAHLRPRAAGSENLGGPLPRRRPGWLVLALVSGGLALAAVAGILISAAWPEDTTIVTPIRTPVSTPTSASQYTALWADANAALAAFIAMGLRSGGEGIAGLGSPAAKYEALLAFNNFSRALRELRDVTPPGEQGPLHRALLPVYHEMYERMETVIIAVASGDELQAEFEWQRLSLLVEEAGSVISMLTLEKAAR